MKYLALVVFMAGGLISGQAQAIDGGDSPYYFSARGQLLDVEETEMGTQTNDHELGYGFSGALGYNPPGQDHFWGNSRFEIELGLMDAGVDRVRNAGTAISSNGSVETAAIMVNYMYDFDFGNQLVPYVGAGAGLATVDMEFRDLINAVDVEKSETTFAYQLRAGLRYMPPSLEYTSFDVGYRFFRTGDIGYREYDLSNKSHQIEFGLNVDF